MEAENSLTLPLRQQVAAAAKADTLPLRIAQINAQRGSFRNITEQSLQAEIDAQKARGDASDEDGEEIKPTELDATERHDLLYKRRADITQFAL
jgi:mediator of RNA polymerase II transcription subunit 17